MIIDLNDYDLVKAISRKDAKGVHKELPPGGVWRTMNGHHIYIKDGKVLAGAIPGVTKAKKASKAHLAEHQANIDKEAKGKGTKTDGKKIPSKPKKTTKGARPGTNDKPATTGKSKPTAKQTAKKSGSTAPKDTKKTSKQATTGATKKTATKQVPKTDVGKASTKGTKKADATTTKKAKGAGASAKKSTTKPAGAGQPSGGTKKATTKGKTASKPATKEVAPKKKAKDIRSDAQKNRTLAYDVGDKVGGARKDDFERNFKEKPTMQNLEGLEKEGGAVAEKVVTKKNIMQPFSFEEEHANGTELPTAILKKLLFDRIAPKPTENTPEGRKAYMESIQKLERHIAGIKSWDNMQNAVRELCDIGYKGARGRASEKTMDSYKENPGRFSYINEESHNNTIEAGKKARAMLDMEPLGDKLENFFVNYKSRESALKTINKNMKDGWDKYLNPESKAKNGGTPKGGENKKWERKAEAEDLRTGGKKITVAKPEELMKNFGVRGVEFGNWVNDASGKYHLQRCAESFKDLADVLGIDDKDISLNGRLAIAFGARGKSGALAHYEPSRKVINMTKYGGAGSLAHEWGHAMDNILFQYMNGGKDSMGLASAHMGSLGDNDPKLKALYRNLMDTISSPPPGEKGGTKKIVIDSEGVQAKSYYPKMRKQVREEGRSAEELYHEWTGSINSKYDNAVARVKNDSFNFYKTDERKDKEIAKYERKRKTEVNAIATMLAYEMQQHTGKPFRTEIEIPTGKSKYFSNMVEMDGGKEGKYFSKSVEMFARVFESYVQGKLDSKKQYNNYLVHGTRERDVIAGAPFPMGKEREHMFKAMENLMAHVTSKGTLKKALILEVLANGRGDMTEELHKSLGYTKRSAYNVVSPEEVIYIPVNRLRVVYQTDQATNWDKVEENAERMKAGENLEPVTIGLDYDIHDGHHRYEASKLMQYEHIPCIVKGGNDLEQQQAVEAYQELWKSFNESEHPRDSLGKFSKVYHTTKDPNFKHDPNYRNSGQEWGSGLYTAPAKDVEYWNKALKDKTSGAGHPYVRPMDISSAKLLHVDEIAKVHPSDRAKAIMKQYGGGNEAREALMHEQREFVTGETYNKRPHEIAEYRLYAKMHGYDGLVAHDEEEGHQVVLFDDSKVEYQPTMTMDDFVKRNRRADL